MINVRRLEETLGTGDRKARWKAAEQLTEVARTKPQVAWELIVRLGSSRDADLQDALATCGLEHVLESHFDEYFPKVERIIREGNIGFSEMFLVCWGAGQSEQANNAKRWEAVRRIARQVVKAAMTL